jgi:phosphocarrier protein
LIEKTIKIQNKLGLHARAASSFVKVAQEFASSITVTSSSATANGKSIMNMMILQAGIDSEIVIQAEGEDESESMQALLDLVNQKFGETE